MKVSWGEPLDATTQSAVDRLAKEHIRPDTAPNLLLTHHLMYTGSAMFKIMLESQEASLELAN